MEILSHSNNYRYCIHSGKKRASLARTAVMARIPAEMDSVMLLLDRRLSPGGIEHDREPVVQNARHPS